MDELNVTMNAFIEAGARLLTWLGLGFIVVFCIILALMAADCIWNTNKKE